jgi:hypothetical protein
MLFRTYDVCPPPLPPQIFEACVKLYIYIAEDVFELLKSHDKELILDHYIEIWKESTLQGVQEAYELKSSVLRRGP